MNIGSKTKRNKEDMKRGRKVGSKEKIRRNERRKRQRTKRMRKERKKGRKERMEGDGSH